EVTRHGVDGRGARRNLDGLLECPVPTAQQHRNLAATHGVEGDLEPAVSGGEVEPAVTVEVRRSEPLRSTCHGKACRVVKGSVPPTQQHHDFAGDEICGNKVEPT